MKSQISFMSRSLVLGTLLLATTACATETSTPVPPPAALPPAAENQTDQTTQATLQTYDETAEGIPVKAQYPDTMIVESTGSSEGVGVFFTFNPQGNAMDEAEVHVFLPANMASTDGLMPMITGPNGLIKSNGWTLDGSRADGATEFPYPWFEMVFDISTDQEQSGHILIGQTNGQAVQVTLLYPTEMADAYWLAVKAILDSLEFEPSLLPVTTSPEAGAGEDPATMCDSTQEPC
jgi:hypothetical protein